MNDDEKDFAAELKRLVNVNAVNNEISLYQNTGDARFFWRAFLMIHENGDPMPKNFLDKLAQWGHRVIQAQSPKEVVAALELSGGEKKHLGPKQSATYEKRWKIASEVRTVKDFYHISLTKAIGTVARNRSMSVPKVKGIYHEIFTAPISGQDKLKSVQSLGSALNGWR